MKGYIGTPLDDSSGTIREMVINYLPSAHHTIRSAIEAMPHVDFILFDGPNKEEIDKMILEKGEKLYSPERRGFLEDWGKRLKNPRELFPFYADLCEKRKMMMLRGDISDEFMFLTYFLEMAALTHYRLNMEYEGLQDLSVREIEEEFPDQVEVISFGSVLGNYARDALIALKRGEDRVIIPANEGRFTDDFMAMKGMDYNGMADDPVWKRRGYKRGDDLEVRTFVGGNMIANDRYVIIGLNPYEESYIEMGEKRCVEDVMRLVRDEEIMVLRGPPIYDHIDVLAMPGEGKLIYVFDPVKTKKLLEEKRINTEEDMGLIKPYMDVSPALMDFFKSRGLTVRPLPFWVTSYNGIPAMLSYPNSLQEDDAIYTLGVSERAENQRLRDIGEVLDDWFYKIFSYSKDVIQIDGFDVPGSWKDAGLRCLGNVLWRE